MADAIEILNEEHRVIEMVLSSLETFIDRMGSDPEEERTTVQAFADFLHRFVDECHHGKEEDYLFVQMNAYGFSKEGGPVSAMLSEQDEGREHLTALTAIGQGTGPLSRHEYNLVKGHALGYIIRIRYHLKREDDILFPMARYALPAFVMDQLAADFENFESNVLTRPVRDGLIRTAHALSERYPPGPSKMPSSADTCL